MARVIEEAMVAAGVLKLEKESKTTTHDRRNSFVAIAAGLINYLQANMELDIAAGAFGASAGNLPGTAVILRQVVK